MSLLLPPGAEKPCYATVEINGMGVFTGWMLYLSPNQQRRSTELKTLVEPGVAPEKRSVKCIPNARVCVTIS